MATALPHDVPATAPVELDLVTPVKGVRVPMHPLTLRFADPLEQQFRAEYYAHSLLPVRVGLAMGIALYALFGILDTFVAPDHRRELWFIRFAVICPLLVMLLAFTFTPSFRRWKEALLAATVVVLALGIIAMTAIIPSPGSYLYYAGVILVLIFCFTLTRLAFPSALGAATVVVLTYLAVALLVVETPTMLLVNNLFFLVSTVIIGAIAAYTIERGARIVFLQRRVIHERSTELEARNRELWQRNRELAESRAATARSARRSELIFAALTEALPGTVLDDKYRVEEKIGSGSFGTVYRGEHILLHHPVAIKVFLPSVGGAGLESLDRFRLEGVSACRVHHPNAVSVLDFEISAGSLAYLVMELLKGRSLAEELRAVGRMTVAQAVAIASSVSAVLAAAHAAGILHRDIKPSNIFLHRVHERHVVKVIDFGIAKLTDVALDPQAPPGTAAGILVGTPAYMAPERLGGDPYDGKADVYSVGVILYEMLSGRPPFVSPDGKYWSIAMKHATEPPPPLRSLAPDVPAALEALAMRALSKDPDDRPTASELAAELARCG